jgi:hypothetical protein
MLFSRADAALIASSGMATSISFEVSVAAFDGSDSAADPATGLAQGDSDLGAAALLQGFLHQAADGRALLALTSQLQDFGHLLVRKLNGYFHDLGLPESDSEVSMAPVVNAVPSPLPAAAAGSW